MGKLGTSEILSSSCGLLTLSQPWFPVGLSGPEPTFLPGTASTLLTWSTSPSLLLLQGSFSKPCTGTLAPPLHATWRLPQGLTWSLLCSLLTLGSYLFPISLHSLPNLLISFPSWQLLLEVIIIFGCFLWILVFALEGGPLESSVLLCPPHLYLSLASQRA